MKEHQFLLTVQVTRNDQHPAHGLEEAHGTAGATALLDESRSWLEGLGLRVDSVVAHELKPSLDVGQLGNKEKVTRAPKIILLPRAPADRLCAAVEPFAEACAKCDWNERDGAPDFAEFVTDALKMNGKDLVNAGNNPVDFEKAMRAYLGKVDFKLFKKLTALAYKVSSAADRVANPKPSGFGATADAKTDARNREDLDNAIAKMHRLL